MSGHRAQRRRRIANEMAIAPVCRFCGGTVRAFHVTGRETIPDDAAQLCRLWPKDDPRNDSIPEGQPRTVLSCWKCARQRHADFDAQRPIEELRWRSGYYDDGHRLNRCGDRSEDRRVRPISPRLNSSTPAICQQNQGPK